VKQNGKTTGGIYFVVNCWAAHSYLVCWSSATWGEGEG
jgi:hypothetical protein